MLKRLVERRMAEKGLSKFHCVKELGYENIGKGLRELDHELKNGISDEIFLQRLARLLEVDVRQLHKANQTSLLVRSNDASVEKSVNSLRPRKAKFRPYLEMCAPKYDGPRSIWLLNASQWRVLVSTESLSQENEVNLVKRVYQKHFSKYGGECMGVTLDGFIFHRTATQQLVFDRDGRFVSIQSGDQHSRR